MDPKIWQQGSNGHSPADEFLDLWKPHGPGSTLDPYAEVAHPEPMEAVPMEAVQAPILQLRSPGSGAGPDPGSWGPN